MDEFTKYKNVSIRTYKRDGDPIDTAVFFTVADQKLYFGTYSFTHKLNRIRRNPDAMVASCTARGKVTGPWREGTARRLTDEEFAPHRTAIYKKHPIATRVGRTLAKIKGWDFIGIEVSPR